MNKQVVEQEVIDQFGQQWTSFQRNEGYYADLSVFKDILGDLLPLEVLKGAIVAEVGSGTGRIVNMLELAGASKIVAIEPSKAMLPLRRNTNHIKDKIVYINKTGAEWSYPGLEYVFSIGVLHHIVDPAPTVANVFNNLKSGGRFLIWLYGKEGNELYLSLFQPLRALTAKLPDSILHLIAWSLLLPLNIYVQIAKIFPVPMRKYMLQHIAKLNQYSRRITIYDQLNPTWAKYYTKQEAIELLSSAGFKDIQIFHRHSYSWTLIGTKP